MALLMQVYIACRIEGQEDNQRRINQHKCLTENVSAKTMVVRLNYDEWNHNAPPSTSIDGVLVRCYFNRVDRDSNYIIAYGTKKCLSKRAIMQFLERYPLVEPDQVQKKVPFYNPPSLQYA
jgi:hypothetical protein